MNVFQLFFAAVVIGTLLRGEAPFLTGPENRSGRNQVTESSLLVK